MIKIKLEKNKRDELEFKLKIAEEIAKQNRMMKRVIFESRKIKGEYNYKVPMRYFEIVFKLFNEKELDDNSLLSYLVFSDDYDDRYYYKTEANASYMRKWREERCPNIYKVQINKDTLEISKSIAFKKLSFS